MLDKSCYFVQYGFQHGIYPCHIDTAGPLKPQLCDGDGFGEDIFTFQIQGPCAWVYVAGETGDAWGLTDKARYKCVQGVVSSLLKKEKYTGSCFS